MIDVIAMVERVGAVEVRTRLGELLARVQYAHKRFIITKDGKEVAALVGVEELERIERLEDLLDVLAVQLLQAQRRGTVSIEALLQQYERLFGQKQPIEVKAE